VDGVLVGAGSLWGPDVGHENPSLGKPKWAATKNPHTQSGSLTKTHHRGTQASPIESQT